MIDPLDNTCKVTAYKIWEIWQASYPVEAALIQADYFPPLDRSINDFIKSNTFFYGFKQEKKLAAVVEVKPEKASIHIQSLVVHPSFFRKGLAQELLNFIFQKYRFPFFTVETGAANIPAIALYLKNDFKEVKEWETDFGIIKVRFERKLNQY